jgi:hypothetical protein
MNKKGEFKSSNPYLSCEVGIFRKDINLDSLIIDTVSAIYQREWSDGTIDTITYYYNKK